MGKKKLLILSAVMMALSLFVLAGTESSSISHANSGVYYAASAKDTRTGVYKEKYTQNGKTTTEWCYLKDGKVQYNYTGFASNDSGWWYVEKGKVTFKKNDIIKGTVKGQSGWWFVKKSQVQFIDSVEKNSSGWWCIQKGKVNFNYNGLAKRGSDWWCIQKGKVNFGYTGLCKYNGSWWYVKGGKVNFGYAGLVKYNGSWWYVKGGKVNFGYTGLCKYNGSWWYVKSGKVDFNYAGLVKYNGSWWYVKNGKVQFIDSVVKYNKDWWVVKNGKVDFSYYGFEKNSSGWWYCEDGKVRFDIKAIIQGEAGDKYESWYVKGGRIQTEYSGKISTADYDIDIKNGMVNSVKLKNDADKLADKWRTTKQYSINEGTGVSNDEYCWMTMSYDSKGMKGKGARYAYYEEGKVVEDSIEKTYDKNGSYTEKVTYKDGSWYKNWTTYDSNGNAIEGGSDSSNKGDYTYKWTSTYDDNGNEIKSTWSFTEDQKTNQSYSEYSYDDNGLIKERKDYIGDGSKAIASYKYNKGNVIEIVEDTIYKDGTKERTLNYTAEYIYNSAGQITKSVQKWRYPYNKDRDYDATTEYSYYANGIKKTSKIGYNSNSFDEIDYYNRFGVQVATDRIEYDGTMESHYRYIMIYFMD